MVLLLRRLLEHPLNALDDESEPEDHQSLNGQSNDAGHHSSSLPNKGKPGPDSSYDHYVQKQGIWEEYESESNVDQEEQNCDDQVSASFFGLVKESQVEEEGR